MVGNKVWNLNRRRRGVEFNALLLWTVLMLSVVPMLSLQIRNLWVPGTMKNGTRDSAILDCDYQLDERDKESLEVKWYHRFDPEPIYQWVPPNPPQVPDKFSRHINLGYLASDNPLTRHRALHLVDLTTELSGRYSCRVSSIYEEDYQSKEMVIYAPPKHVDLEVYWIALNTLNLTCSVQHGYPEPKIKMIVNEEIGKRRYNQRSRSFDVSALSSSYHSVGWHDGAYFVSTTVILNFPLFSSHLSADEGQPIRDEDVLSEEDLSLICQFWIPKTDFREERRKELPLMHQMFFQSNGCNTLNKKEGLLSPYLLFVFHSILFHVCCCFTKWTLGP